MGVMGWSNTAMAARYQHITATIRRDVAQRVGGLLWEPTGDPSPEPPDGNPTAGTAAQTQLLPRAETERRSSSPAFALVKGGGSGGIRTPGWFPTSRFQVAGDSCGAVCARLSTCKFASGTCVEPWSVWQSVATRLLHRRRWTAARLVATVGHVREYQSGLAAGPVLVLVESV